MKDIEKPTVVSTFAGCGGSSLGYQLAGFHELLAVEWDQNAVDTFCLNFSDVPVYNGDICKLTGDECMKLAGIGRGELDVLDGSPPCQGFSTAGKRKFNDSRNSLFMEFARLLSELQPKAFVMENVTGMVKGHMKQAYLQIIKILRECGYRARGEVMNAMWFNMPQSRERVIIIGVRNDVGIEPSHPKPQAKPVSAGEALSDIGGITSRWRGDIRNAQFNNKWRSKELPSATLNASQPPMVKIEIHLGYEGAKFRDGPSPTLAAGRKTRILREIHAPHVIEKWENANGGDYVASFQGIKIDPERPSPTQIAAHRNWKWNEARYLTIEEAKILQSFPERFQIDKYSLIGNSVPPNLMKAIAEHVRETILDKITLPEADDIPAGGFKENSISAVPRHVCPDLVLPELAI